MDEAIVKQIFDELLSSLEPLEARSAALLQFVKDKGIATEEELAPYLEQAGNASNVRWRAVRVRTAALIASAMKPSEPAIARPGQKSAEPNSQQSAEDTNQPLEKNSQNSDKMTENPEASDQDQEKPNQEPPQPDAQLKEPPQKEPPQSESPQKDEAVEKEKKEAA
jgi:hypothetical protein